ncbi:MAG: peroxidase family protein, partial [Nocardioides sp.]
MGALCAALTGLSFAVVPVTPAGAAVTDNDPSFEVDKGDLRFILKQIKISEAHENDGDLLCESELDTSGTCVPHPLLPWGLRTVDGSYNNLMPGQDKYGAADQPFPRLLPEYLREGETAPAGAPPQQGDTSVCADPAGSCYAQVQGFVYDSEPRMVSNLIVDQTTSNPAAIAAADTVPGSTTDADGRIFIPNEAPDEALSAPFNSWFTLFGQFFDHGLDLVQKGGAGTIIVPLSEDDPLYNSVPPSMRFMTLSRATVNGTNPDGSRQHTNQTTPFVDQNQTYTSHPSHQVFLREYELVDGAPESTGHLLDGAEGGLASWAEVKAATAANLGIALGDEDVLNLPMLVTDLYGQFTPGP